MLIGDVAACKAEVGEEAQASQRHLHSLPHFQGASEGARTVFSGVHRATGCAENDTDSISSLQRFGKARGSER